MNDRFLKIDEKKALKEAQRSLGEEKGKRLIELWLKEERLPEEDDEAWMLMKEVDVNVAEEHGTKEFLAYIQVARQLALKKAVDKGVSQEEGTLAILAAQFHAQGMSENEFLTWTVETYRVTLNSPEHQYLAHSLETIRHEDLWPWKGVN